MENEQLRPSPGGIDCIGNGTNPEIECQCDECDHFLTCFPEWKTAAKNFKTPEKALDFYGLMC